MSKHTYNCPRCNSNEFVTEPNQYDILVFTENGFEIQKTEQVDDCKTFCRECSAEIDISQSKSMKKICLVKTNPPKTANKI